jgi:hypothetical protein
MDYASDTFVPNLFAGFSGNPNAEHDPFEVPYHPNVCHRRPEHRDND